MAEILISLTIIGVIAAIVIPSLVGNINEKTWKAKQKAFYSRLSQAIALMPKLNGYGEYAGTWNNNSVTVTKDNAAQAFVTEVLNKVLQINSICSVPYNMSSENTRNEFAKCGLPLKYTKFAGTSPIDFPTTLGERYPGWNNKQYLVENGGDYNIQPLKDLNTKAAAFETKNGESVAVFYNPQCVAKDIKFYDAGTKPKFAKDFYSFLPYMCANFLVDFNGKKGPNKIGKDMWSMTALYPTDSDIITVPFDKLIYKSGSSTHQDVKNFCTANNARFLSEREGMAAYFADTKYNFPLNEPSKYTGFTKFLHHSGAIVEVVIADSEHWWLFFCIKR